LHNGGKFHLIASRLVDSISLLYLFPRFLSFSLASAGAAQMPTPSTPSIDDSVIATTPQPPHTSCPPDDDRASWRSLEMGQPYEEDMVEAPEMLQQPTPPPSDLNPNGPTESRSPGQSSDIKQMDIDEESLATQMLSPASADGDKQAENELPALSMADMSSRATGDDFSNIRVRPIYTELVASN
jgi:hypothetical protein